MTLPWRITCQKLLIVVIWCVCQATRSKDISAFNSNGLKNSLQCESIIVQYLTASSWKSILLLTDKDDHKLFRQLSDAFISVQLLQPFAKPNVSSIRQYIHWLRRDHVVVYCKSQCEQLVISWVYTVFPKRISWLFIHQSLETMNIFLKNLLPVMRIDNEVFAMVCSPEHQNLVFHVSFSSEKHVTITNNDLVAIYSRDNWSLLPQGQTHTHLLQSQVLRLGVLHEPPTAIIRKNGSTYEYGGLFVELVKELSFYLGFRCKFVINPSGSFGSLSENGSWTGFIRMLLREEIDVAIMPLALTKERIEVTDFSTYILEANTVGIYRIPSLGTATLDIFTYFRPFPRTLWFWLFAMLLVMFVCMTSSTTQENQYHIVKVWPLTKYAVACANWTLISIILRMGVTDLPRKQYGRLILIFSLSFMLVISSTYNCLLTAFLTVRKQTILFRNFEEVLEDATYSFATCDDSAQMTALKMAKKGTFQKIWRKMIDDPTSLVNSVQEGIDKSYKEQYVFIQDHLTLEHFAASNCSLRVMKQNYMKMTGHIVFQKNSQYEDVISQKLLAMRASGVLQKETRKYYQKPDPSTCSFDNTLKSVRILDAAGAPICFLLGLFASVNCFILEIIVEKIIMARYLP